MWLVYKHTNIVSGKSYIGLTKRTLEIRWKEHVRQAFNESRNYKLHNAIRKYGSNTWESSILKSEIPSLEEASEYEKLFIEKYNSCLKGYNTTIGGEGTELSEEYKQAANELREKKKFIHYEHGYVEATLLDMVKWYGVSKGTLSMVLTGTRKHHKGWQAYELVGSNPTNYTKVEEIYDFYHEDGEQFKGTKSEFVSKYNLKMSKVSYLVLGKSKYYKGWSTKAYKVNYRTGGDNNPKSVISVWYNTKLQKIEIASTSDLCRKYNLSTGTLTMVVKGKRKHHKNWKYYGVLNDQAMKHANAEKALADAEEARAKAEKLREETDLLANEFLKDVSGQSRREHEIDKEFDAAVKLKEKSKVQQGTITSKEGVR